MANVTCTTCGRSDSNPFRVTDGAGRIIAGCVDACHTGKLPGLHETSRWHNRPEAKKVRKVAARFWGPQAAR